MARCNTARQVRALLRLYERHYGHPFWEDCLLFVGAATGAAQAAFCAGKLAVWLFGGDA